MDGYEVDPATLESAAGALHTVADRADEAVAAVDRLGGDLGPGGLSERVGDLAARWRDDVGVVRAGIAAVAASTHASGRDYRDGDRSAQRDF